jgi:hypothetical protein
MEGPQKERWLELCQRAAVEQDSKKLMELIRQIDALLQEKRDRLARRVVLQTNNEESKP